MALQAQNIGCTRGERMLFAGLDLSLSPGDALQVAGANGSGKSSLLRILCGLTPPGTGEVRWRGMPIRKLRDEYHRNLAYVGHAGGIKDDLLAWENLVVGAALAGVPVDRAAACEALERTGLAQETGLPARVLSQGQRKRLGLARLWLDLRQPLWVLDEPFTALDTEAVRQLCSRLARHLDDGGMLVYTTHQEIPFHPRRQLRMELGADCPC